MPPYAPLEQRFWYYVTPNETTGCWEWTGARRRGGYGSVNLGNQVVGVAYKAAYELCRGDVPKTLNGERVHLMHLCDNPPCVNPWHLRIGTAKDNARDAIAKGRAWHPPMRPDVTKCKSGKHDWVEANIYRHRRKDRNQVDETCRLCAKERAARRSPVLDG